MNNSIHCDTVHNCSWVHLFRSFFFFSFFPLSWASLIDLTRNKEHTLNCSSWFLLSLSFFQSFFRSFFATLSSQYNYSLVSSSVTFLHTVINKLTAHSVQQLCATFFVCVPPPPRNRQLMLTGSHCLTVNLTFTRLCCIRLFLFSRSGLSSIQLTVSPL